MQIKRIGIDKLPQAWLNKKTPQVFCWLVLCSAVCRRQQLCVIQEQEAVMLKMLGLAAAFVLAAGATAPAGATDILVNPSAAQGHVPASPLPDLAALPAHATLAPARASELPEPEVVAMMLLGLVLIGYKASRDSDEKFS